MKLRLVDQSVYDITRAEVVGEHLEIDFQDKTAEEVQEIFSTPGNLAEIQLLTDDESIFGKLPGWTAYGGVMLNGDIKTAILAKPADVKEERMTAIETKAIEAQAATEEQAQEIEGIKQEIAEGGAGVDQELFSASVVVARAQAQALTDDQALQAKVLYPTFDELVAAGYTAAEKGYKFCDGDNLYKTAQENVTFQAQYRPGEGTESLYTRIDEAHAGTLEDPIPAKANMEYEYGKYYIEDGVIYICKRGGVENPEEMYGQKVTLQYLPSALIGQYFVIA